MRIIVRPRHIVNEVFPDLPHVIISISDPGDRKYIQVRPLLLGTLHLEFYDLQPDVDISPEALMPNGRTAGESVMQPEHAERVWDFIRDNRPDVIVIHCDAGMSRSPSMARAICDQMGWPRACIDPTGMGVARNQHVYWVTRNGATR